MFFAPQYHLPNIFGLRGDYLELDCGQRNMTAHSRTITDKLMIGNNDYRAVNVAGVWNRKAMI